MGRFKPKKQRGRPGVSARTVGAQEALTRMAPEPKSGDWRPDVLGAEKLSMGPGPDGWPLINGHRVTREMCKALQAERPGQAADFDYDDLVAMAAAMGGLETGGPLFGKPW